MTAGAWAATLGGLALVAFVLREVFHTLLHPSGVGRLTPAIFRVVWRSGRRLGGRSMDLAGPTAVVLVIASWTLLLILGWALVYWPHLPGEFVFQGLEPSQQDGVLDAVYLSGVALATLGFGDIVAQDTLLRLALVAEAAIGFGLLSASITWVLSVYPALMRRRSLASRVRMLLDGEGDTARLAHGDPPANRAALLHGLAEQLATVRVDLVQYPASYFYRAPAEDLALAPALCALREAVTRDDIGAEVRGGAAAVVAALDALERTLAEGPFGLAAPGDGAMLRAYAVDHRPSAP